MSLTSYRAAPPRVGGDRRRAAGNREWAKVGVYCRLPIADCRFDCRLPELCVEEDCSVLGRPGDDLLSHVLRQSTIGAKAFDGRVRDGIGSDRLARATRPAKNGFGRRRTEGRKEAFLRRLSSVFRLPREAKLEFARAEYVREQRRYPSSVLRRLSSDSRLGDESNQVGRAISTGQLHALPRFHIRPIDVVVFHGSSGRTCFEAGFPLRCLQRLSIPYIATLHRRWRDDRSTRDTFTPVLSY